MMNHENQVAHQKTHTDDQVRLNSAVNFWKNVDVNQLNNEFHQANDEILQRKLRNERHSMKILDLIKVLRNELTKYGLYNTPIDSLVQSLQIEIEIYVLDDSEKLIKSTFMKLIKMLPNITNILPLIDYTINSKSNSNNDDFFETGDRYGLRVDEQLIKNLSEKLNEMMESKAELRKRLNQLQNELNLYKHKGITVLNNNNVNNNSSRSSSTNSTNSHSMQETASNSVIMPIALNQQSHVIFNNNNNNNNNINNMNMNRISNEHVRNHKHHHMNCHKVFAHKKSTDEPMLIINHQMKNYPSLSMHHVQNMHDNEFNLKNSRNLINNNNSYSESQIIHPQIIEQMPSNFNNILTKQNINSNVNENNNTSNSCSSRRSSSSSNIYNNNDTFQVKEQNKVGPLRPIAEYPNKFKSSVIRLNTKYIANKIKTFLQRNSLNKKLFCNKVLAVSSFLYESLIEKPKEWSKLNSTFKLYYKKMNAFINNINEQKMFIDCAKGQEIKFVKEEEIPSLITYNISNIKLGDNVDTGHITKCVRKRLSENSLKLKHFCEGVLRIPLSTMSTFCSKPKLWNQLTDRSKSIYILMHAWLKDPDGVQKLREWRDKNNKKLGRYTLRTRKCCTKAQQEVLLKVFEVNETPDKDKITELANMVNLNERAIVKWFRNRRYKIRYINAKRQKELERELQNQGHQEKQDQYEQLEYTQNAPENNSNENNFRIVNENETFYHVID